MQMLGSLCAGRAGRAWSAGLVRPALQALSLRCAASKSAAGAATGGSDSVSKEDAEYWQQVLDSSVDKTTARALLAHIDVKQVLGLPPTEAEAAAGAPGVAAVETAATRLAARKAAAAGPRRAAFATRKGRLPLYTFFKSIKKQFPKAVALVRVGEFYEAMGIDAVLLVQHAGLNPMGQGVPPRAGCPRQNLRRTVADLVSAGLTVAVCEEVTEAYSYGSMRNAQKQRYVAAVVSPANPHMLHGLIDEDADLPIDSAPPLLAVAPKVGGFTVLEVSVDTRTVRVMDGLTEDAVYARLHEGGLVPPLFLHVPASASASDQRLSEGTTEREWEQRVASIFRAQVGVIERYSDQDEVQGLLTRVRCMLGMDAKEEFVVIRASSRDRPRPLYYSTALNLGLHKSRGQPCLLDYLLPPNSPLPARRWLRGLLLLPPMPAMAVAVRRVCAILAGMDESLPVFPLVPAASVVLKLRNREANDTFFREVGNMCGAMLDLLSRGGPQLPQLADSLLEVACRETGVEMSRERLRAGCAKALTSIHNVVDHDTELAEGDYSTDWLPDLEGCAEAVQDGMWRLIRDNEGPFRGKVRDEVMADACEAVELACERVQRELEAAFTPLMAAHEAAGELTKQRPTVVHDVANNALWIKVPRGSAASSAASDLHHPHDRNGKVESSVLASHGMQSALDDYRKACYDAGAVVRDKLRELAVALQDVQTELVCASTIGVAAAALTTHTREALRRQWCLPTQGFTAAGPPQPPAPWDEPDTFDIAGMWPYWLDGWDPATVENSLNLQAMALLTGPNMAGKSTILRSVCAVALLGACGLYAPAASATVPYFDAFMLRNFSSDSPLEGRSAFAVEMTEMRYVLQDVTPQSLVLVDELGKGTEVRAGASLAGALVEELDRTRCRGIFATHLHALLDLNLDLSSTEFLAMETATVPLAEALAQEGWADVTSPSSSSSSSGSNGSSGGGSGGNGVPPASLLAVSRRPTWRIVPGVSTESLALDVARRCRLPPAVVARAAQLYQQLAPAAPPQPAAAAGVQTPVPEAGPDAGGAEEAGGVAGQVEAEAATARNGSSGGVGQREAGSGRPRGRAARGGRAASGGSSGGSSSSSSPWTIQGAAATLQQVAQDALGAEGGQQLEVKYVLRGQAPGPAATGASCTYVLCRPDGHFYVGTSDSINDRIRAHRQRTGRGGPDMVLAYVKLSPSEDAASLAKAVESGTIRELQRRGFPLVSDTDGRRRHVWGGGGTAADNGT